MTSAVSSARSPSAQYVAQDAQIPDFKEIAKMSDEVFKVHISSQGDAFFSPAKRSQRAWINAANEADQLRRIFTLGSEEQCTKLLSWMIHGRMFCDRATFSSALIVLELFNREDLLPKFGDILKWNASQASPPIDIEAPLRHNRMTLFFKGKLPANIKAMLELQQQGTSASASTEKSQPPDKKV